MADVLIGGMEMPKSCRECYEKGICYYISRLSYCPLLMEESPAKWVLKNKFHPYCRLIPVPDHGRLVDADAVKDIVQAHDYPLRGGINSVDNGMWTIGIFQAIDEAPTVIPASGGGS